MIRKPISLLAVAVLTMGLTACSNNTQNLNDGNAKRMALNPNNRNNDMMDVRSVRNNDGNAFPQNVTSRDADINLFNENFANGRKNNRDLISAYETNLNSDQYPQTKAILMEGAKYQFIPTDPNGLLDKALGEGGLNPQGPLQGQTDQNPQGQWDQTDQNLQGQFPDQNGLNAQENAGPNLQGNQAAPNIQGQLPNQGDQQQEPAAPAQPKQDQTNVERNETKTAPKQQAKEKANTTGTVAQYVQQVIDLTNEQRRKNGISELKANKQLSDVAQEKAADMQRKHYFSHTSPTYGSPFDMMRDFGVTYKSAGENIAKGQRTPEEVVNAWMNSEGHRKNILNPSFTSIGVGFETKENNWSQMFIGE